MPVILANMDAPRRHMLWTHKRHHFGQHGCTAEPDVIILASGSRMLWSEERYFLSMDARENRMLRSSQRYYLGQHGCLGEPYAPVTRRILSWPTWNPWGTVCSGRTNVILASTDAPGRHMLWTHERYHLGQHDGCPAEPYVIVLASMDAPENRKLWSRVHHYLFQHGCFGEPYALVTRTWPTWMPWETICSGHMSVFFSGCMDARGNRVLWPHKRYYTGQHGCSGEPYGCSGEPNASVPRTSLSWS